MNHRDYYGQVHTPDGAKWEGKSHGSIQWKGTNVCMDVHCECGAHSHIDADFFYHFECFACGKKYAVSSNVALLPLTDEQVQFIAGGGGCGFIKDEGDHE